MGTWGIGPFDNDDAAGLSDDLEEGQAGGPVRVVRRLLTEAAGPGGLEADLGAEVVAAAALLASQLPPAGSAELEGSRGDFPAFPADLRPLAVRALDRVLAEDSELAGLWAETAELDDWRDGVLRLRAELVADAGQPVA